MYVLSVFITCRFEKEGKIELIYYKSVIIIHLYNPKQIIKAFFFQHPN